MVIQDHPYGAVSDKDGKLVIKNIPVGTWTFQLWQEKFGYITQFQRNNKTEKWRRGRMVVKIKPGMNDLGELHVNSRP